MNWQLVCVDGDSMEPTYKDGEVLFMKPQSKITKGDVIVLNHPYISDMVLVKRIKWMDAMGQIYVIGDNSSSTDSRSFGTVSKSKVLGKVVGKCSSSFILKQYDLI